VIDYCPPSSQTAATDAGIERVKIGTLLDNITSSGVQSYESFTTPINVTVGLSYAVTMSRPSNIDPVDRIVWADWNRDGDFDDKSEVLVTEIGGLGKDLSFNMVIPSVETVVPGAVRLRSELLFQE
jgi:hypothetical protein